MYLPSTIFFSPKQLYAKYFTFLGFIFRVGMIIKGPSHGAVTRAK